MRDLEERNRQEMKDLEQRNRDLEEKNSQEVKNLELKFEDRLRKIEDREQKRMTDEFMKQI